ncbi:acetyl-CoA carboxylase biotin carboxyl carrier protein subunit [Pajaroellobacter abortibovis]|uniref:Lipoyl-binding domain-containing protein n=1 Tax=Pajaroellobacter abortibovis TaxID=1882918 RepID=A0A1L6MW60_9BACT|nr:acetyl-CoA carboxylase biotin carboxyl carrier protein subunit [Pajaroellobacter abortibovis]APR99780.1 hypothetical protein BCY86_03135 [Pajaroellobacter abortibovis]
MKAEVYAPITGTVWKVHVQEGELVEQGQTCITLESMKMEIPVDAPHRGQITTILHTYGAFVSQGDVLFTLFLE